MKPWIRKWGIYITTLLSSSAVNIIAPFYSKVAEDQGIHPWLIGIIYASCPLAAFISSCYIPRHLEKIGRTTVLCTGLIIVGLSNIILVFLPNSSYSTAVFLSFLSRIAEGVGCSFCMITANTTLTSDYPEDLTKIIATIEIMSGIGLSAGPALGSVIFKLFGFKSTCLVIGCSILCYSPLLFLIIGKSRIYKKTNDKIDLKIILSKKVRNI
jgi:MFS family permease